MPRLSEVIAALDALWPPEQAEGWDAVGTVCGDPDQEVTRVLFAVDPVQDIVDEAVKLDADLLVTHHPLYLRGTTTVAAGDLQGPCRAHADQERHRAARRPHQRRPCRSGRQRRPRRGA